MHPGLDSPLLVISIITKTKNEKKKEEKKINVLEYKESGALEASETHDFPILKNFSDVASVWFLYFGQCFFHRVNEKPKSPHLKSSVKLKCEQVLSFSFVVVYIAKRRYIFNFFLNIFIFLFNQSTSTNFA